VGGGPLAVGGGDRARLEGPGVVGEGGREAGRAQEHVDALEVAAPGGAGGPAPLLLLRDLRRRRWGWTPWANGGGPRPGGWWRKNSRAWNPNRWAWATGSTPSGQPPTTLAPA